VDDLIVPRFVVRRPGLQTLGRREHRAEVALRHRSHPRHPFAVPRRQALRRQRFDFLLHRLDSDVVRSPVYDTSHCTPDERRGGTFGIGFLVLPR
jgi:hypothetical protein